MSKKVNVNMPMQSQMEKEDEEYGNDLGWEDMEEGHNCEWMEYQKFINEVDQLDISIFTESEIIKSGKALIIYKLIQLGFGLEPSEESLTKTIVPVKFDEDDFMLCMYVRDLSENHSLELRFSDEEMQLFKRENALLGIVVQDSLEVSVLIVDTKYALRYLILDGCIDLHYRYLWPKLESDTGVIIGEILGEQPKESEIKLDEKERMQAQKIKQLINSIVGLGANNIYENIKTIEDMYLRKLSSEMENLLDHLAKTNGEPEAEIIRLKHGFNIEEREYSTSEIARKLDIKLIEVEDLYRKGLRMLRHPSRFKSIVIKNSEGSYQHYQEFLQDLFVLEEKHQAQFLNEQD